jgi:hypothetical protein
VAVADPPSPLAVAVYVVVVAGVTVVVPDEATVPTPLSIATDFAFVELHVRVAGCPAVIDAGATVNVMVGALDWPPPLLIPPLPLEFPPVEQAENVRARTHERR